MATQPNITSSPSTCNIGASSPSSTPSQPTSPTLPPNFEEQIDLLLEITANRAEIFEGVDLEAELAKLQLEESQSEGLSSPKKILLRTRSITRKIAQQAGSGIRYASARHGSTSSLGSSVSLPSTPDPSGFSIRDLQEMRKMNLSPVCKQLKALKEREDIVLGAITAGR
ncbi:hypothetical protein CC2G_012327 [Coprinopsis cinerea AmutBmut pab1-1]|nr:hypothetical protein CC2G_012327 [Coprinopsis cinerea AmutBmut pab1-1]